MTEVTRAMNQGSETTSPIWIEFRSERPPTPFPLSEMSSFRWRGSMTRAAGGEKGPRPILVNATALRLYSWLRLRLVKVNWVVVAFKVRLE